MAIDLRSVDGCTRMLMIPLHTAVAGDCHVARELFEAMGNDSELGSAAQVFWAITNVWTSS